MAGVFLMDLIPGLIPIFPLCLTLPFCPHPALAGEGGGGRRKRAGGEKGRRPIIDRGAGVV